MLPPANLAVEAEQVIVFVAGVSLSAGPFLSGAPVWLAAYQQPLPGLQPAPSAISEVAPMQQQCRSLKAR